MIILDDLGRFAAAQKPAGMKTPSVLEHAPLWMNIGKRRWRNVTDIQYISAVCTHYARAGRNSSRPRNVDHSWQIWDIHPCIIMHDHVQKKCSPYHNNPSISARTTTPFFVLIMGADAQTLPNSYCLKNVEPMDLELLLIDSPQIFRVENQGLRN